MGGNPGSDAPPPTSGNDTDGGGKVEKKKKKKGKGASIKGINITLNLMMIFNTPVALFTHGARLPLLL